MELMITAIWPSYATLPNSMPASSGTETNHFVAFFLFWAGSLPAIWFPVHKIRHLFTVKAYFVPVAGIAFFIWAIVKAKGIGPIVNLPAKAQGSELGWGMVMGIMSSIANFATLIVWAYILFPDLTIILADIFEHRSMIPISVVSHVNRVMRFSLSSSRFLLALPSPLLLASSAHPPPLVSKKEPA